MTDSEFVEKINPPGQKSKIFLSDGSVVWLNAKSSISYFKHFTDSTRIITLKGEAFFDVAKDSLNPFIVRTNGITVEVLGTQFNVNSRNPEEEVTVALVEGVVKVFTDNRNDGSDAKIIMPGEGIVISSQHDRFDSFTFDISGSNNPYSSWKDGFLVFNGESYNEFITKIKLWYDIEVQTNGIPPVDWDIRGNFPNESLDNIMKAISYNKEFTYKIDRKKLMLNFN
jgi:ferric-dicitrate binding protein FerR (iron transport regulator)